MASLSSLTETPNLLELAEAYRSDLTAIRGCAVSTAERTDGHLSHLSICDDENIRSDLSVFGDEVNGAPSHLTGLSSVCADESGLAGGQSVCADESGPAGDQSVCADEIDPGIDQSLCADEGPAGVQSLCADEGPVRDQSVCADEFESDLRLKTDIEQVGTTVYGLPLYHFRYKTGAARFEGVMAQDVLEVMPDAVVMGDDGYYRVKYGQLGIRMTRA